MRYSPGDPVTVKARYGVAGGPGNVLQAHHHPYLTYGTYNVRLLDGGTTFVDEPDLLPGNGEPCDACAGTGRVRVRLIVFRVTRGCGRCNGSGTARHPSA